MKLDVGDVAGMVTGAAVSGIATKEARKVIDTGEPIVDSVLAVGIGLAVGGIAGSVVDSVFDGLFGDD